MRWEHRGLGSWELCLIPDVFGTLEWNYSIGSWTYGPKAGTDHLNGDVGIEICIGSNEKHKFEESHGETSDKKCRTLGGPDT